MHIQDSTHRPVRSLLAAICILSSVVLQACVSDYSFSGESASDLASSSSSSSAGGVSTPPSLPPNVDLSCSVTNAPVVFPPENPLVETVPASCLSGFEMNNFQITKNSTTSTYTITSSSAAGTIGSTPLEVDLATYAAPNFLIINSTASGVSTQLLDQCQLQTADYSDPTLGAQRPPEDSIRHFSLTLPPGTQSITFTLDNSTPYYVRVLGLCDFNVGPPTCTSGYWRTDAERNVSACTSANPDKNGNPQQASCPAVNSTLDACPL